MLDPLLDLLFYNLISSVVHDSKNAGIGENVGEKKGRGTVEIENSGSSMREKCGHTEPIIHLSETNLDCLMGFPMQVGIYRVDIAVGHSISIDSDGLV